MHKRQLSIFLVLTCILIIASPTCEGILIELSYEELWDHAYIVALGKVTRSTNHQGGEFGAYQLRDFEVERYYKGSGTSILKIKEEGGDIGWGSGVWVEDQPELQIGERYLLFLAVYSGSLQVVGGPQGAFKVSDDIAYGLNVILKVGGDKLDYVYSQSVKLSMAWVNEEIIENEPMELYLSFTSDRGERGHRPMEFIFRGISGEATGLVLTKEIIGFVGNYGVSGHHTTMNFTASGQWRLEADGLVYSVFNVTPAGLPTLYKFTKITIKSPVKTGSVIEVKLDVEGAQETEEPRIVMVVRPRNSGVQDYCPWYVGYENAVDGEITSYLTMKEPGNYTVSIWSGGVKVLTGSFMAEGEPVTNPPYFSNGQTIDGGQVSWQPYVAVFTIILLVVAVSLALKHLLR